MKAQGILARAAALLLIWSMSPPELLQARYTPSHGSNMFTVQQELDEGQKASGEVTKELKLLPDSSPTTQYVQRLGAKLAAHAPGEKWPYNFHVVQAKEINAFALPGGPIYVNLGTIQAADNEAQLAGVMAHEISHVVQRHATRAATKQAYAQAPLAILGGLLGGSTVGQLAQLGISFGVGSYFLKNSRSAENEADLLGTDIMYDSGYDPHQMAEFFRKLEEAGGAAGPQFLSDHPNPGNRVESVSREVATLPGKNFRTDTPEFQQIKKQALATQGLTAQEMAQQGQTTTEQSMIPGVSRSEVMPSANLQVFEHEAYQVQYPENWQVFGDKTSSVTIAPKAGIAQNAVAYGVIINGAQPEEGASLDQATHELIQNLLRSNQGLKLIGHAEDIKVNGVAGKSVDLIGASPVVDSKGQPLRERDWLVTLQRSDGSLVYCVFVAPDQDFGALRPTFERMLKSTRLH